MKNNRLTHKDIRRLRQACERMRKLASLENANFSFDKVKDEEIKDSITPYMDYFVSVSRVIDDMLDGKDISFVDYYGY